MTQPFFLVPALLPPSFQDVVLAYCHMMRTYNGDWAADPAGAASALLEVSAVLTAAAAVPPAGERPAPSPAPVSASAAVEACVAAVLRCHKHAGHGRALAALLLRDVAALLGAGRAAAVLALSDAHEALGAAAATAAAATAGPGGTKKTAPAGSDGAKLPWNAPPVTVATGGACAAALAAKTSRQSASRRGMAEEIFRLNVWFLSRHRGVRLRRASRAGATLGERSIRRV